jgi:DNA-directed RNA polymerase specialized sigma24 family protein
LAVFRFRVFECSKIHDVGSRLAEGQSSNGSLPQLCERPFAMSTVEVEDLGSLLPQRLPRLWAFSLRLCGNRHDAEDRLQRACVRGLERAHQLQPGTAPLSWMLSIVHSIWINELRARKGRRESCIVGDDSVLQTVPDPSVRTPEQSTLYAVPQTTGAPRGVP